MTELRLGFLSASPYYSREEAHGVATALYHLNQSNHSEPLIVKPFWRPAIYMNSRDVLSKARQLAEKDGVHVVLGGGNSDDAA